MLVFDDADIPSAVDGLMAAKFRASGQTCVCANRVYVQEGVYDKFLESFTATVKSSMIEGHPMDEKTTLGPMISPKAVQKVRGIVSDATKLGAKVAMGQDQDEPGMDKQSYHPAMVLGDMTGAMRASQEEIFGPVAAFYKFKGEEDLYDAANEADVGLASYVFTKDLSRAWRAAETLQSELLPQCCQVC